MSDVDDRDSHLSEGDVLIRGHSNSYRIPTWAFGLSYGVTAAVAYYTYTISLRPQRFLVEIALAVPFNALGWWPWSGATRFNQGREWAITPESIHFNNSPLVPVSSITHVGGWSRDVVIVRRKTDWRRCRLTKVENAAETRDLLRRLMDERQEKTA